MLEHVPAWLGGLFRNVRASHAKLVIAQPDMIGTAVPLDLCSPAFGKGERLPERFTADGIGISPPLTWGKLPRATARLVLIVAAIHGNVLATGLLIGTYSRGEPAQTGAGSVARAR